MPSPIVTATCQAAGLSTVSNLLAQIIEARQESRPFVFDFTQLLRFVALTLITAPPNFVWQQLLEKTFPAYLPATPAQQRKDDIEMKAGVGEGILDGDPGAQRGQERSERFSLRNTLTKWFVDCMTMGAIMNTIAFLVIMGIMKGQGGAQIMSNIKTETIPIIVAGYKIWPIASIISFSFIPVHRRIVFLSFVGLLWGIYMSLVASKV
ncbi:integral membrane protein Mpv17 PMP22 family [Emericellopsis cladophorae]|uniref:Integral membrane protein Mpv17 PMP22 family n=1 Tax=Emericellopsis cladophorae TaxID=2686198 RepID=A0A9P9Y1M2_9HYPO|nr:integral membrane protein Mpv17 PMP22 family [Emericellopsis cladophorae]KAI6781651.1 integral membrane protein Mpv17 PMP22 family [Emericellopsis cladophorae]